MNTQTAPISDDIRGFLEGLLADAGMANGDEALKEEMLNELYSRLDNYITSVIVNNLPPESLDEFIKMNEAKRPQAEIEVYLKEKMPNSQEIMGRAFVEFRDLYLGKGAQATNTPGT